MRRSARQTLGLGDATWIAVTEIKTDTGDDTDKRAVVESNGVKLN